ncbi:MAG TPA: hypothetical protein VI911_00790 [Patescibacteria group bacterium]|nr:hypothetical protein [Patescibacteria group bacterium]
MSRKTKLPLLKAELKQLASSIRSTRLSYKEAQRANIYNKYTLELCYLNKLKEKFRYKHIVYCLLHGTPMEKIEVPGSPNYNPPYSNLLEEVMKQYEKDVCAC